MNTVMAAPGHPQIVYVQQVPVPTRRYDNYNTKLARGLGITRIVNGALIVILQIATLVLIGSSWKIDGWGNYIGVGVWGGFVYILTGCFSVGASKRPTKCMIITHMVFSVLSVSIVSLCLIIFSAVSVADAQSSYDWKCSPPNFNECWARDYYCLTIDECNKTQAVVALDSVLIALAVIHSILDIIAAALCCRTVCCCTTSTHYPQVPSIIYQQTLPGGAGAAPEQQQPKQLEALGSPPPYA